MNHECPFCHEECDCEKGSRILKINPDIRRDDLDEESCDHECEDTEDEDD
jgi:hypothetical protein